MNAELRAALDSLLLATACRCELAGIGLHTEDCLHHLADAVDVVNTYAEGSES